MDYNDIHAGELPIIILLEVKYLLININGQNNQVEIPEKISKQEVIEIGEEAFSDNLILEHVQLPDLITVIKDNAYDECYNLKIVYFGMGIKKIGDNVFAECESLQAI